MPPAEPFDLTAVAIMALGALIILGNTAAALLLGAPV